MEHTVQEELWNFFLLCAWLRVLEALHKFAICALAFSEKRIQASRF